MKSKIVDEKNVINNSSNMEEVKKGGRSKKDTVKKEETSKKTPRKSTSKDTTNTKDKKTSTVKKKVSSKKDTPKEVKTESVKKDTSKKKNNESVKDTKIDIKENKKSVTRKKAVTKDESKDKETIEKVDSKKKEKLDNVLENEEKKSTKSNTAKSNSVADTVLQDDLESTGAIKTLGSGSIFSELLNNKLITIEKEEKVKKDEPEKKDKEEKEAFDGRFRLDILDILIIIVITAIISCVFSGFVLNYQYKKASGYFDKTIIKDENVQKFLSLYSEILSNYYEEVDSEAIMKAAMKGMMSYLEDTYSIYLSDEESDDLNDLLESSYEGIGIVIQTNKIVGVYKNSSAEKAGVLAGDEIVGINGTSITDENYMDIGNYLKKDEDNTLVVRRNGEELSFVVSFSKVTVPTTSSTTMEYNGKKIGYIQLTSFSTLSLEDFRESLTEVEDAGIQSLIIDLRSNSGGYLKAAYDIASIFTEKGKVIYSLEQKEKVTKFVDETDEKRKYSVVVLVNNSSASASEVLAAALHDSYGATIVGKTTFGKGTVQTIKHLDDDSIVKYTSAKWLRPNGECVNGIGITPDYEVDIEYDNAQIYDKQLDKAIELLSK